MWKILFVAGQLLGIDSIEKVMKKRIAYLVVFIDAIIEDTVSIEIHGA